MKRLCIFCCLCLAVAFGASAPVCLAKTPTAEASSAKVASLDADDDYLNSVGGIVIADPLEPVNRAMHSFNDTMLEYVARPAYKGYAFVTPEFVRTGLRNVFHNLMFPARFVNNLLQGKGRAAGVEMSRFILNSTAGIGGFFDVAARHKPIVPVDNEDMGQTFGVWGLGEGFYIVWPMLGPSTARDSAGMVGDYFLDPLSYVRPWGLSVGLGAARTFTHLEGILDSYDEIRSTAVEPYSAFRDAYVQYRRAKVAK